MRLLSITTEAMHDRHSFQQTHTTVFTAPVLLDSVGHHDVISSARVDKFLATLIEVRLLTCTTHRGAPQQPNRNQATDRKDRSAMHDRTGWPLLQFCLGNSGKEGTPNNASISAMVGGGGGANSM